MLPYWRTFFIAHLRNWVGANWGVVPSDDALDDSCFLYCVARPRMAMNQFVVLFRYKAT